MVEGLRDCADAGDHNAALPGNACCMRRDILGGMALVAPQHLARRVAGDTLDAAL